MQNSSLLNTEWIIQFLKIHNYCFSHINKQDLDNRQDFIGIGLIYYTLGYLIQSKLSVCLGSGDGFVPNLMKKAQKDLTIDGQTILVDANMPEANWGVPLWVEDKTLLDPDVIIIQKTTKQAFDEYFTKQSILIDYLHIDADHSYEHCLEDFQLFSQILSPHGIITLHDTKPGRTWVKEIGVPKVIEYIKTLPNFEVINFPNQSAGTAIVKHYE